MKIKDLANEIKKQMPDDLNELETLRYIYLYIGKRKSFNPDYYFGNRKTRDKIYILVNKKIQDEEFLTEKRDLICVSIASTLKLVAKEFGIDIVMERDDWNVGGHVYNSTRLKDGRYIMLDLQLDLKYIQAGRRTKYFGMDYGIFNRVYEKELEEIDEKIGYKEPGKDYKDEDIKLIIEEMKKYDKKNKLGAINYALTNEKFLEGLKETEGYIEALSYVRKVINSCFEVPNVDVVHCYRDTDINNKPLSKRQYSMCIFAQQKKSYDIYLFKKKEKIFEKVSRERMKRLISQGLKIKEDTYMSKVLMGIIKDDDRELLIGT